MEGQLEGNDINHTPNKAPTFPRVKSNEEILDDINRQGAEKLARLSPVRRSLIHLGGVIDRFLPRTGTSTGIDESTGKNRT